MINDISFKKYFAFGIFLLFIGLICNPIITAQTEEDDLVDLEVGMCGFPGNKHTVQLTQNELYELDELFDSIGKRLNETKSTTEAKVIFYDAIEQLSKYGLLSGLSAKQVQDLFKIILSNQKKIDSDSLGIKENSNCIIAGRVTGAFFFSPAIKFLNNFLEENYDFFLFLIFLRPLLLMTFAFGYPIIPLRLGSTITLGGYTEWMMEWATHYSNGWIVTAGENRTKKWVGDLLGDLDYIDMSFVGTNLFYVGVDGFFGLKIYNPLNGKTSFMGYAKKVKIESGWIDEIKHPALYRGVILRGKALWFQIKKVWDEVFDSESENFLTMLMFARSLWQFGRLHLWVKFWKSLSEKYDWKWRNFEDKIYF